MSVRTGPFKSILTAVLPATVVTPLTTYDAGGNSTKLLVTTATGGCGNLTITAEISPDGGTTYYNYVNDDSTWSFSTDQVTTAGSYIFDLAGLETVPRDTVRLSYVCGAAAGTIAISVLSWENPAGHFSADIEADIENISVELGTTTVYPATGAAAISHSTGAFTTAFELSSITLLLSAAGTTAENLTIDLNAADGAAYDANLLTLDLSTDSVTSLVVTPTQDGLPSLYETGDSIDIAWPNSESRTYGLRIVGKTI